MEVVEADTILVLRRRPTKITGEAIIIGMYHQRLQIGRIDHLGTPAVHMITTKVDIRPRTHQDIEDANPETIDLQIGIPREVNAVITNGIIETHRQEVIIAVAVQETKIFRDPDGIMGMIILGGINEVIGIG